MTSAPEYAKRVARSCGEGKISVRVCVCVCVCVSKRDEAECVRAAAPSTAMRTSTRYGCLVTG